MLTTDDEIRLGVPFGGAGPVLDLRDGLLHANVALPGLAVHYTLDGLDPTARSPRYDVPVAIQEARVVKLASVDTRGRASRIVTLNVEQP